MHRLFKSSLFQDLVTQYKTHLEPNFVGINLPAYFGGITLQNKSLEQLDICEVLSYLKGNHHDLSTHRNMHKLKADVLCFVCIFSWKDKCFFLQSFNLIFL